MVAGRNPNRPFKGEGRILVDEIVDSETNTDFQNREMAGQVQNM